MTETHQDGYPAWYALSLEIALSLRATAKLAKDKSKTLDRMITLRRVTVEKLLPSMLSPVGGVGLQALAINGGVHWSLVAACTLSTAVWESLRAHEDEEYLR